MEKAKSTEKKNLHFKQCKSLPIFYCYLREYNKVTIIRKSDSDFYNTNYFITNSFYKPIL